MRATCYLEIIGQYSIFSFKRQFADNSWSHFSLGIPKLIITSIYATFGILLIKSILCRQILRHPLIIGIEKCNQLSTGLLYPPISSSRNSSIGLMNQPNTRVIEFLDFLHTVVCRAIIDNHNFKILKGLFKNRL